MNRRKRSINATLLLKDGSKFHGFSFGAAKATAGEVVFNTGMVGYPESLTDPSYFGQILVLTYPLIGNYGVPVYSHHRLQENFESFGIKVKGLVVSNCSENYSHYSANRSLGEWLTSEGIPGIYGIDTRSLTKKLREKGTMRGKIIVGAGDRIKFDDPNKRNVVSVVSIKNLEVYGNGKIRILIVDCGVKHSIIRALLKRNVQVIRIPWNYNFSELDYDGLIISNGPGDPKLCKETIRNIRWAIEDEKPIMGICLGNQILALAAGADTYKLKYGHRSQNQPCIMKRTKKCFITSQNHGYAVKTNSLPAQWQEWFINANDKTNEGIIHKSKPFFAIQFHPEANPGPQDTEFLFDEFLNMIKK